MSIMAGDNASPMDTTTLEDLELVAGNYRKLVLLVGMAIAFGFVSLLLPPVLAAALLWLVSMLFGIAAAFFAFHIATGLGDRVPILWAIGMFVPLVGLVALIALSRRVQTWCQRRGIAVGILGPTTEGLADFRKIIAMRTPAPTAQN